MLLKQINTKKWTKEIAIGIEIPAYFSTGEKQAFRTLIPITETQRKYAKYDL